MPSHYARRPISQALSASSFIRENLKKTFDEIIVCGSIRRERPTVGDIDIIVTNPSCRDFMWETAAIFSSRLPSPTIRGFTFERGINTPSGLWPVSFLLTDKEHLGSALLYYTGSSFYNDQIRKKASQMGLSFDHSGLRDAGRKEVCPADTEKSITDFLGMNYIHPTERGPNL